MLLSKAVELVGLPTMIKANTTIKLMKPEMDSFFDVRNELPGFINNLKHTLSIYVFKRLVKS